MAPKKKTTKKKAVKKAAKKVAPKTTRAPYVRRTETERRELVRKYDSLTARGAKTVFLTEQKLTSSHISGWRKLFAA